MLNSNYIQLQKKMYSENEKMCSCQFKRYKEIAMNIQKLFKA